MVSIMASLLFVAVLIIIWYVIYSRKKGAPLLSAQQIKDIVSRQMKEIDDKIVSLSIEGKTFSLPPFLASLEESKAAHAGDKTYIEAIDNLINDIIKKYGAHIPPHEAFIDNGEMIIWSEFPGCFERHLQRRYRNILFPSGRRIVSKKEIEEARAQDKKDQEKFISGMKEFVSEVANSETDTDSLSILRKIVPLLEETAALGGPLEQEIKILEDLQDQLLQKMTERTPELHESLKTIQSYSFMARIPFMAQRKRKDTPILKNEELSALLSEDLETIAVLGYVSRSFPNFRPSDNDVRAHLDDALHKGYDIERAGEIWNVWIRKQGNL